MNKQQGRFGLTKSRWIDRCQQATK